MLDATYPPPVAALLTLGDGRAPKPPAPTAPMPSFEEMMAQMREMQNSKSKPRPFDSEGWPDYPQMGIGPEHVPALLAMARDNSLIYAAEDSTESWAPLHAWRAIGQLRATEAIEPLRDLLDEYEDWDIFNEEISEVFGLIGPAALPALSAFLLDPSHEMYARVTAGNAIAVIGRMHPETREGCITVLTECLAAYAENDPGFNAMMTSMLLDLEAVEALPLIKAVYDADAAELSHLGDWEDVEIAFGVRTERDTPRPRYAPFGIDNPFLPPDPLLQQAVAEEERAIRRHKTEKKEKNKQKMADKSRKQNRKKK